MTHLLTLKESAMQKLTDLPLHFQLAAAQIESSLFTKEGSWVLLPSKQVTSSIYKLSLTTYSL